MQFMTYSADQLQSILEMPSILTNIDVRSQGPEMNDLDILLNLNKK